MGKSVEALFRDWQNKVPGAFDTLWLSQFELLEKTVTKITHRSFLKIEPDELLSELYLIFVNKTIEQKPLDSNFFIGLIASRCQFLIKDLERNYLRKSEFSISLDRVNHIYDRADDATETCFKSASRAMKKDLLPKEKRSQLYREIENTLSNCNRILTWDVQTWSEIFVLPQKGDALLIHLLGRLVEKLVLVADPEIWQQEEVTKLFENMLHAYPETWETLRKSPLNNTRIIKILNKIIMHFAEKNYDCTSNKKSHSINFNHKKSAWLLNLQTALDKSSFQPLKFSRFDVMLQASFYIPFSLDNSSHYYDPFLKLPTLMNALSLNDLTFHSLDHFIDLKEATKQLYLKDTLEASLFVEWLFLDESLEEMARKHNLSTNKIHYLLSKAKDFIKKQINKQDSNPKST